MQKKNAAVVLHFGPYPLLVSGIQVIKLGHTNSPAGNLASGSGGDDVEQSSWDNSTLRSVVIAYKKIVDLFLLHVVCEDKSLSIAGIIAIAIIIAIAVIVFETKSKARM
jgi:hypothetical protein